MSRLELAFRISRAVACASVSTLADDGENEARPVEVSRSWLSRVCERGALEGESGWTTRPNRPPGGETKVQAGGCLGRGLEVLLAPTSEEHDVLSERCASSSSP